MNLAFKCVIHNAVSAGYKSLCDRLPQIRIPGHHLLSRSREFIERVRSGASPIPSEDRTMNVSEGIVILGKNFIERRIILFPQEVDIDDLRAKACGRGYKCGWVCEVAMGLAIVGVVALCTWLTFI
jgi:hypothetical protein